MRLRTSATAVLAALFVGGAAFAQQRDLDKVEIKSEKLTDNLYVLTGMGGSVGLLTGPDGAVIIDDQVPGLGPKIQAAVAALTDKPVRFTLNTHYHFDHTGNNETFGRAGSVIVAHDNTRARLPKEQVFKVLNISVPPPPPIALPVVTFPDRLSLHLNGQDIDALYLPNAHTDSDVAYFFRQANIVHMGDVFAGTFYPFVDSEGGGSFDGVIAALEKVAKWTNPDTRFIRGHGAVATRAEMQEYHDMLVAVRKRVVDAIKAGKTQEQVVASQPPKDFDAKYGMGMLKPDVFVQRLFVDLRRSKATG